MHTLVDVQDHDDCVQQRPPEALHAGRSRPPLFERIPPAWHQAAVAFAVLLFGVAAGGGAVLWWQARPAPPPFRADEHGVELVLFEVLPQRRHPSGRESDVSPLQIDGALLLSGGPTSTVLGIDALVHGLAVRAPSLPVTISPTGRFQPVTLEITVRDCRSARLWTPGDHPFTIRWRDEFDTTHLDTAGDFGRTVAMSLIRYTDAVCDTLRSR